MSGGEPSSIKRLTRCAARVPVLSRRYEDRVEEKFDFAVYGLVLQHTLFSVGQFWLNRKSRKNNTENSVKLIFTSDEKAEETLTGFIKSAFSIAVFIARRTLVRLARQNRRFYLKIPSTDGEFWLNRKSRKNNTENSVKFIFTSGEKAKN